MKINILTLFPEMFTPLNTSMLGKAQEKGLLSINFINFRDYAEDKHHSVDDTPYGGGAGMLLMPPPIYKAMAALELKEPEVKRGRVILLDPAGKTFDQQMATDFAQEDSLVFICGHYEGYDHRVYDLATDIVSMGDYVVTGGELGAMAMIDATSRLIPGVLGNQSSAATDSFAKGLLEYPQYTRPVAYDGKVVPEVLRNGDHEKIRKWRLYHSLKRTYELRPELLNQVELSKEALQMLRDIKCRENEA